MTDELVIAQTQKWVADVVIGCNFCPFAGRELLKNAIHYTVVRGDDIEVALSETVSACRLLDNDSDIATLLLLFPDGFADFEDYLDLVSLAEDLLEMEGYSGVYQVASFHPNYLFGGSNEQDPANYTNRSMVPMLHLLREESVTRAVEHFPDIDDIPNRNIAFATEKGLAYMRQLRAACANVLPLFLFAVLNILFATTLSAQTARRHVRQGNYAYEAENYTEAEESYRKGLEKEPNSLKATYNLGNALYHQKRYDEAIKHYDNALQYSKNNVEQSRIYHNIGNACLAQNKLKESIEAYKNAIRQNPLNEHAKYNLNIALQKLKKQQNQQQNNKNQQQNNKNQPKNQAQPENQNPQNGNAAPQQQDKNEAEKESQPQNQPATPENVSQQQARELLRIMDNEEKKVQTKQHKFKGAGAKKNGKDW